MTSQQRQYILAVAQERSFSKAAKKLFLTQPSLSKAILSLEKELGCRLFDRSVSPLALTEAGRLFVQTASEMEAAEQQLLSRLGKLRQKECLPLRLGNTPFRARYYLPLTLGQFHKLYPNSELTLCCEPMVALNNHLLDGTIDLAIGPTSVPEPSLEYERLPDDHIYLALPPQELPFGEEDPYLVSYEQILSGDAHEMPYVDLARLSTQEFISYPPTLAMGRLLPRICAQAGFKPNILFTFNDFSTALGVVQQGCCCTLTFETVIRSSLFSTHPRYYRIDFPPWEVIVAFRKNYQLNFIAREFLRLLKELL